MTDSALILAGHGSHISPNTAGVVWSYVDRLRALGAANEVTACFWKEPPALSQVLDTVEASQVFVVPVFTAQGYFTASVIPSEMALRGPVTMRDGKTITLTRPLGEHPAMTRVVRNMVRAHIDEYGLDRTDTAVAIIGHGTRRNPDSRDTTRYQAKVLREMNWVGEVVDVYLDDEPDIPSIYRTTFARNVIAIPYFLAPGSHVSTDVPRALGLSDGAGTQTVAGRRIFYTQSLSGDASICSAIHELAMEAGLPLCRGSDSRPWNGFPTAGRDPLMKALKKELPLRFGQVMVTEKRVWHCDNEACGTPMLSAAQLRAWLREDPFRPLPTSADLPTGWHVDLDRPADAHAVLETVYPGLVADWAAKHQGEFLAEPLKVTSERQVGMFKGIHNLAAELIERTVATVCGACVRQPTWWKKDPASDLPCKAACNYWLSSAAKLGESAL
ncbi:MAG: DR2241 family protein [Chloroflexi bacterium]|nr:DR2241 family protein [Chloroflexota bacterium]